MEEVVTSDGLKRFSHWYPIFDAPKKVARASFSLRRRAAFADVVQIEFDFKSWNENNVFGEQLCQGRRKTRPEGRRKNRPLPVREGVDLLDRAGVAGAEACASVQAARLGRSGRHPSPIVATCGEG